MNKLSKIFTFILFSTLSLFQISIAADELGPIKEYFKIDKIEIIGTKKVEKEAILERILSKKGNLLDNYVLKKDITKIYSMKYFEYVEAHQVKNGALNILRFVVKERPIITTISFDGSNGVSKDDLTSKIKSKQYSILDINTIKSDITEMLKLYEEKGFYLASIDYKLNKVSDENVKLTFKIKEYDKVKVKKISFLGNRAFSDNQLKGIMETKEESLFSFINDSGNFKEFNFHTDLERIKYFYKSKGYLQVNSGTPQITVSEDKKWVFITVKVNEGPQFELNNIFFEGDLLFSISDLTKSINMKEGDTYSEVTLRKDIQKLTEKYQDEGYAFANVIRTLNIVPGESKVDLEFSFEKGKKAKFGRIIIKGNSKTRDKVIRRELNILEGQEFSGTKLRESKEKVNRLGFFEPNSVIFNTVPRKGKDDVLDVEVSVKERNTGQISLGAGYSTASGPFMQTSISQNNFRGLGQTLSLNLSLASNNQTYNLGFSEPYLFDKEWTVGGDVFRTSNSASDSFNYKKQGFDLRAGRPLIKGYDPARVFLTYKFEDTTITEINDDSVDASIENGTTSSVRLKLSHDKRNNRFEPSSGHYVSLSTEYAGIGGDKKWMKSELDGRFYASVIGDLVFRSRLYSAKLNKIDGKTISRTEKFTLGGARNLRGYGYEAIGPITEKKDKNGKPVKFNQGGLTTAFTTLELEHPLIREAGLKWVVFFDAGNIFETDIGSNKDFSLFMDYGFGFRWFSPIGVLRFEFGYPIGNGKEKTNGSQFHFDIGQLF